jgi:phosphoglycolate phosphatase-like HAD superfamily hydrolase
MSRPADLADFIPARDRFIGIDSDGCAFDSMAIKWQECFIPRAIEHCGLQPIARDARRCLEFVNLYSQSRGVNRFFGLLESLDWLARLPTVAARGFAVPPMTALRRWTASNPQPTTDQLRALVAREPADDLVRALAWSDAANADIRRMVRGVPPFPPFPAILADLAAVADILVVSSTPVEALRREWDEHGLTRHVRLICGQETGAKAEVLRRAAAAYPRDRALMIGDAPGDRRAAATNGIRFYPIVPQREEECWRRFADEALDRFLAGTYAGAYEDGLAADFAAGLPAMPDFLPAAGGPAGNRRSRATG